MSQTQAMLPPMSRSSTFSLIDGSEHSYYIKWGLKVEFPCFMGNDLQNWFYRCENFFDLAGTLEDAKVKIAIIHLDNVDLHWYQNQVKLKPTTVTIKWAKFVRLISTHFGLETFDDLMSELLNPK